MSSRVSQPGLPEQCCGVPHDPFSPIAPTPSSADVSVSEAAKKVLLDPKIPPSDGSCPLMRVTGGDNQPFYERLISYLPKQELSRLALICGAFLQKVLEPLLASFGITYPFTEATEEQTLERITTILNPLKESDILTEDEKNHFSVLSAEEIIQNPKLLYLLLNTADRHNLVAMISKNVSSLDLTEKSFPQKITAVLEYLQEKEETIEKLECKSLYLTNIPEEICDLKDLVDLDVDYNNLTALPDSLGRLSSLQILSVSNNNLTALPYSLGNLLSLQRLYVSNNHLTAFPASLGSLFSLQLLSVDNNHLTALPDSLGSLSNLTWLSVNNNEFTTLPDSLCTLTQLVNLNVNNNKLTSLPEWIGGLSSLQWLYAGNNNLTTLPDSLGKLSQLQIFDLRGNHLTALPEWLSQLRRLLVF
jgi:Leucine-rich repeat (LRR) protein